MKEDKKLVGGQKKLDVDGDGSITADDFAALRERTQKQMGGMMEGSTFTNSRRTNAIFNG